MDNVLFYQPRSGMDSSFPHGELFSSSKFRTSPLSGPSSRQSSITAWDKPADGFSQLRGTDDVDGDESGDEELPSLKKLLSPARQARRSNLKPLTRLSASQNPSRSHSLNPSVQTAKSSASSPFGTTSAPRRSLFKRVPAWSFLNSLPAHTPTPTNQAMVNEDAVHNRGTPALSRSNELAVLSDVVLSPVELDPMSNSSDGHHTDRGNSQENPIVVDDDSEVHLTVRSSHTLCRMTIDNPELGCENMDTNAGGAHVGEVAVTPDLDDAALLQCDNHSAIATPTSSSPKIPESDNGATLDGERQLHRPLQGDSIASPSGKRGRSPSGPDRADGRGSDWVFDVFAEDDGGTKGDGSPPSKRARSSSHSSEAAEYPPPPAVAAKGVQMFGSAHDDRPPRGDQEYEVHQVVGESGSEYEVTALTKLRLSKASVDPKLVRKYRAERRAATRVRTRWSSRLQNKN